MLVVDDGHEGGSGWKDVVYKQEHGLISRELDTLANNVDELSHRKIGRDQVLLLVNVWDVRLICLFLCGFISSQPASNNKGVVIYNRRNTHV